MIFLATSTKISRHPSTAFLMSSLQIDSATSLRKTPAAANDWISSRIGCSAVADFDGNSLPFVTPASRASENTTENLRFERAWVRCWRHRQCLSDQIKLVLASSLNSLFMVSRGSSDNVLQIRFGGASNPVVNSGFTMVAQAHNVTFLLLVKQT